MKTACILLLLAASVSAHIYTKCELAKVLVQEGVSRNQVHKWVCMANAESSLNTNAFHRNSRTSADHGLFQINDYWNCDPQNGQKTKNGCGQPCSAFKDNDLRDDVRCVKRLLSWKGNDFSRVSYGYKAKCQGVGASYLSGCSY